MIFLDLLLLWQSGILLLTKFLYFFSYIVAYGTYRIRDQDNEFQTIAKTIRQTHNAELVRQVQAIIRQNGMTVPSVSTIFK